MTAEAMQPTLASPGRPCQSRAMRTFPDALPIDEALPRLTAALRA